MEVFTFNPELYPRKLFVCKGTRDPKCVNEYFTYRDGDPLILTNERMANCSTYRQVVHKETKMYGTLVVIWPDCKHTPGQIAHEAVHAANAIFEDLGVNFVYREDEHYAYFVQWLTNKIWEVETGKAKK